MSANTSSNAMGIIVQYDFCDGCHACEMACKQEHGLKPDQYGIKIMSYGPKPLGNDKWDFINVPVPTGFCDMCAERTAMGKLPACVHHCPSKVMEYGPVAELAEKLSRIKGCVLYAPGVE